MKKLTKKHKIIAASLSVALIGAAGAGVGASYALGLLTSNNNNQVYNFDGKIFNSRQEVMDYALSKADVDNYFYQTSTYTLDGKVFQSFEELQNYIDQNFKINNLETILNPNDYLINATDELSSVVANDQKDKLIRVYEGANDLAYKNRNEALETYINPQKVYDIDGQIRYNEDDATRVFEDMLEKQASELTQQKVYKQGAIYKTEEQITNWLYDKQTLGFEYGGKTYSDANQDQFEKDMKSLDYTFYDKYIHEVLNPDMRTYWLSDKHVTEKGYYVGPKYIETTEQLPENPKWNLISSYDPGLIMSINTLKGSLVAISNLSFDKQIINNFNWSLLPSVEKDIPIKRFMSFLYNNGFIGKDMFNNDIQKVLYPIFDNGLENILIKSTDRLDRIDSDADPDFGNIQKMFIAFSRILSNMRLAAGASNNDIKIAQEIFKKVAFSVLETNNTAVHKIFQQFKEKVIDEARRKYSENNGEENNDDYFNKTLEEVFSFDDLFNFFMNPARFIAEPNYHFEALLNVAQTIEGVLDNVMKLIGAVATIGGAADKLDALNVADDEQKTTDHDNDKLMDKFNDTIDDVTRQVNGSVKGEQGVLDGLGIVDRKAQSSLQVEPQIIVFAILAIIAAAWTIQKLLGFVSWKTFEFKIDDNQSGYYTMPVYKLPIFGVEVSATHPEVEITKLADSLIDYLPVNANGVKTKTVYQFENMYFSSWFGARDALIREILRHPESYLHAKKVSSSILEKDDGWTLPAEIYGKEVVDDEKLTDETKQISRIKYQEILDKNRLDYAKSLFKNHYDVNGQMLYLDGLGGGFTTAQQALDSLKEKYITKDSLDAITKYEYTTTNKEKKYFDSLAELRKYAANSQVVDSKLVFDSELKRTSNYHALKEEVDSVYQVYKLNYYGESKYFGTEIGAVRYLMRNLNYSEIVKHEVLNVYSWNGEKIYGSENFSKWIDEQLEGNGSTKQLNNVYSYQGEFNYEKIH